MTNWVFESDRINLLILRFALHSKVTSEFSGISIWLLSESKICEFIDRYSGKLTKDERVSKRGDLLFAKRMYCYSPPQSI